MKDDRAKKMYDYHVWANQKVFQHLKQLPKGIYKERINSVFSSISDVMVHLYATDITWLETIKKAVMRIQLQRLTGESKRHQKYRSTNLKGFIIRFQKNIIVFLQSSRIVKESLLLSTLDLAGRNSYLPTLFTM